MNGSVNSWGNGTESADLDLKYPYCQWKVKAATNALSLF
jgi:hypothetical protein